MQTTTRHHAGRHRSSAPDAWLAQSCRQLVDATHSHHKRTSTELSKRRRTKPRQDKKRGRPQRQCAEARRRGRKKKRRRRRKWRGPAAATTAAGTQRKSRCGAVDPIATGYIRSIGQCSDGSGCRAEGRRQGKTSTTKGRWRRADIRLRSRARICEIRTKKERRRPSAAQRCFLRCQQHSCV